MKFNASVLKDIIAGITPLSVKRLYWKSMRSAAFSGVFKDFAEAGDEHPWESEGWIELSRQKLQAALSGAPLDGYLGLTAETINELSGEKTIKVLDFAGGTGFVYYRIFPFLAAPDNVLWHVVDNATLIDMGRSHKTERHRLAFFETLPPALDNNYDVVYINASLQYIDDHVGLLKKLLTYRPRCIILTRLLAGDIKTYVTSQINVGWHKTPCRFLNAREIISFFDQEGFDVLKSAPNRAECLSGHYDKSIPTAMRIPCSMDIVFRRR
ncbi:MAG: methyltransferase, TIGR04325 family [Candidatus Omnitrophica bacterium]|nr:methyltransferase, TIGR04325 family [Candidatus Omnitrophota bacterium]MDD5436312.1 methyltransferase, TIGR04325 family [Candidatus Omnitrophota bacterium]